MRHEGRPAAGEEPAASREGISPALGSPHLMRDVGPSYGGARRDVHRGYHWSSEHWDVVILTLNTISPKTLETIQANLFFIRDAAYANRVTDPVEISGVPTSSEAMSEVG